MLYKNELRLLFFSISQQFTHPVCFLLSILGLRLSKLPLARNDWTTPTEGDKALSIDRQHRFGLNDGEGVLLPADPRPGPGSRLLLPPPPPSSSRRPRPTTVSECRSLGVPLADGDDSGDDSNGVCAAADRLTGVAVATRGMMERWWRLLLAALAAAVIAATESRFRRRLQASVCRSAAFSDLQCRGKHQVAAATVAKKVALSSVINLCRRTPRRSASLSLSFAVGARTALKIIYHSLHLPSFLSAFGNDGGGDGGRWRRRRRGRGAVDHSPARSFFFTFPPSFLPSFLLRRRLLFLARCPSPLVLLVLVVHPPHSLTRSFLPPSSSATLAGGTIKVAGGGGGGTRGFQSEKGPTELEARKVGRLLVILFIH